MMLVCASGGTDRLLPSVAGRPVNVGADLLYLSTGETDVINERNEFLGRYTAWDGAFGVHAAMKLSKQLGIGASLKLIYSYLVPDWVWTEMPELGISSGGTGATGALDLGAMYRPIDFLSLGTTLANIGPNISYTDNSESDPLPWMLRLGAAVTPYDGRLLRVRFSAEADKILVGMFYNPDRSKTVGRMLQEEWRSLWRSVAVEAMLARCIHVRLGYFEDIEGQRGGIVFERPGYEQVHYGLDEVLIRRNLGKLKAIGICWGIGIGYRDYVRVDLSDDHALYDFPTQNWKVSLTVNNIEGFVRELLPR